MGVIADEYGPFNAGPGASVGEPQWGRIYESLSSSGVSPNVLNQLAVVQRAAGANMSVDVRPGQVFLMGHQGRWAGVTNLPIAANVSGSTRYDRVIARANRTTNIVELDIKQGSGAVVAVLQQDDVIWESHIATVTVATGAVTIGTASILYHPIWAAGRTGSPVALGSFIGPVALPPGVTTIFNIDTVGGVVDNGGFFDPAHPSRLTAPQTGVYLAGGKALINEAGAANANAANVAKGLRALSVFENGGSSIQTPQQWWWGGAATAGGPAPYTNPPDSTYTSMASMMQLAAGEYVEMGFLQSSGGAMQLTLGSLWIIFLGVF